MIRWTKDGKVDRTQLDGDYMAEYLHHMDELAHAQTCQRGSRFTCRPRLE